ncbi:hypothetical protein [Bacillus altitudinis]|nr:hypothetical protein [Bacillus altitudinis]
MEGKGLKEEKVGVVGMGGGVKGEVGVKEMRKEELKKMLSGKMKKWKEVGGKEEKMRVVKRGE